MLVGNWAARQIQAKLARRSAQAPTRRVAVRRGGPRWSRVQLGVASWSFSELPTPWAGTSEGLGELDSGRKGPESQGLQRQPPSTKARRKTRGKSYTGASHGQCQMLRLLQ